MLTHCWVMHSGPLGWVMHSRAPLVPCLLPHMLATLCSPHPTSALPCACTVCCCCALLVLMDCAQVKRMERSMGSVRVVGAHAPCAPMPLSRLHHTPVGNGLRASCARLAASFPPGTRMLVPPVTTPSWAPFTALVCSLCPR